MELELSLNQKQILSQRMQQSVKILQMNALDLNQYIQDSALENPLIELEQPYEESEDTGLIRLKKLEWLDSMDESNSYQYARGAGDDEHNIPLYEKKTTESLSEELVAQLPGFHLSEKVERRVRYLIGSLDENGYILIPRDQLLRDLAITAEQLGEAFGVLHRMDPPGVGAADLRECLLIQALREPDASPILLELIKNHIDMLAKNQLDKLAKALQVSIDEVKDARDQLLKLNPKPGNGYSSCKAIPYIWPDLFVVHVENRFEVILNDNNQPKIKISSYYRNLAKDGCSEVAGYVNENLAKAEWLISCIQQRMSTILRCAGSILGRQIRFFEQGPGNLAPMTLADVAEDMEMHPSTISRAIRGKYLQCQWGVFGLSDFFSRSVSDVGKGGDQSQDMVLNQIDRIIANEDPAKPFSDQEIASRLEQHGMSIARRTVAKYREQMGLPPASGRKKF